MFTLCFLAASVAFIGVASYADGGPGIQDVHVPIAHQHRRNANLSQVKDDKVKNIPITMQKPANTGHLSKEQGKIEFAIDTSEKALRFIYKVYTKLIRQVLNGLVSYVERTITKGINTTNRNISNRSSKTILDTVADHKHKNISEEILQKFVTEVNEVLVKSNETVQQPNVMEKVVQVIRDHEQLYLDHIKEMIESVIKEMKTKFREYLNRRDENGTGRPEVGLKDDFKGVLNQTVSLGNNMYQQLRMAKDEVQDHVSNWFQSVKSRLEVGKEQV